MDKVRLGRVLGKATRMAARTAYEAVDAATAPDPGATSGVPRRPPTQQGRPTPSLPTLVLPDRQAFSAGAETFRNRTLKPWRHASRALWLELTGSFFALFALSFAVGVWKLRAYLHSPVQADHLRFAAVCALALLFAWFSVSSFMGARRRG